MKTKSNLYLNRRYLFKWKVVNVYINSADIGLSIMKNNHGSVTVKQLLMKIIQVD